MIIKRRVAIAGPTCSGKTTLAARVAEVVPEISILHFDMYDSWPSDSPRFTQAKTAGTLPANWEDPALYNLGQYHKDLDRWGRDEPIVVYDNLREGVVMEGRVRRCTIPPKRHVLVEGLFPYYSKQLMRFFDQRVFLDLPLATMVERRLSRDRGDGPWDSEEYIRGPMVAGTLRYVLPQQRYANYILDATLPTEELVAQLVEIIYNAHLPGRLTRRYLY